MSDDLGLDLDLGLADDLDIDIEVPASVREAFGVEALILADESDTMEFADADEDAAGSDDELILTDSILIKTSDSIVETMAPYAASVREAIALFKSRQSRASGVDGFVVPYSNFSFMPEDVFKIFCQQLKDLAQDPSLEGKNDDEVAEVAVQELFEATRWSPQLMRPELLSGFKQYYGRLRRALSVSVDTVDKNDITSLMDYGSLVQALRVFEINTIPFEMINNFFDDSASMASTALIDFASLGEFIAEYMQGRGLTQLAVRDVYDAVGEYLSSQDIVETLHLSQDEMLEMKSGELLRRVLLYELDNEVLYPSSLRGQKTGTDAGYAAVVQFLLNAIQDGSVVAAILFAIGSSMSAIKEWADRVMPYLDGLLGFFLAFLDDSSLVNPVYYGHVIKQSTGFSLSYAVGDKTYEVQSDSVLCDVIGDKSGARCIPSVLVDERNGFTVCPPPALFRPLQNLTRGGRTKVSGAMCYRFTPTTSWLAANQVLAEDATADAEVPDSVMQTAGSSLLQMLLEYDNQFDDDSTSVLPVVVSAGDKQIYAIGGADGETYRICGVTANGVPEANDGVLLSDKSTGSVVVRYTDRHDQLVEQVYDKGTYEEDYLGTSADEEVKFNYSDFLLTSEQATTVDVKSYCLAVSWLCSLCALDYAEELEAAMRTVAREFFYVAKVPAIDTLVASRILKEYQSYAQQRLGAGEEALVDSFNLPSVQELFDIVCGKPNVMTGHDVWSPELAQVLADVPAVTIEAICGYLDSVDFDRIALWMLNPTQIRRDPNIAMLRALHFIPAIGSRLTLLENKLIVMRVMALIGEDVLSIFGKRAFLVGAYRTPIDSTSIEYVHSVLVSKSKKKDIGFTLPLCQKVLKMSLDPTASSFKYYVLERNVFGLLSDMQVAGDRYSAVLSEYLEFLGFEQGTDITSLGELEFSKKCGRDLVVQFFNKFHDSLMDMLYAGLVNEVFVNDGIQVLKAYDLFNAFYDLLLPSVSSGTESIEMHEQFEQDFIRYAGSMLISYAPVVGVSADELDGGEVDRFMQFVKSPDDFVYDVPIGYLRGYKLEDMRVFHDDAPSDSI